MATNIRIKGQSDVETITELFARNNITHSIAYTYDVKDKMLFIDGAIITIMEDRKDESKKN